MPDQAVRALAGIHHVTAIAGDPQRNAEFYVGILGLRLVKRSVNQDDPGTYHLFYADARGSPGTDLTFFPYLNGVRGVRGNGQAVTVAFAIPEIALNFWAARLTRAGVEAARAAGAFGEEIIAFADPDGLRLELVAGPGTADRAMWSPWLEGPVPVESAIRGIHGVTAQEAALDPTAGFVTGVLGFRQLDEADGTLRFGTGGASSGAFLDLLPRPGEARGRVAAGTVHHVAWRTPDDDQQRQWREEIAAGGVEVTPVIDRFWFHSIYFREPGGVLFEIATDGPGFTADEAAEHLGERLVLPPWLEPERQRIEASLPPLRVEHVVGRGGTAR
jgi:glyoxalase family protein